MTLAEFLRSFDAKVAHILAPKPGTTPINAATIAAMLRGSK